MSTAAYLDTSALVKLVRPEAETRALFTELSRWKRRVSSALSRVELYRTLRRAEADDQDFRRAEALLQRLVLIQIDDEMLQNAAVLPDKQLRSLDAIHLATALSIRRELGAVVVYDAHLREVAQSAGLFVISPGTKR